MTLDFLRLPIRIPLISAKELISSIKGILCHFFTRWPFSPLVGLIIPYLAHRSPYHRPPVQGVVVRLVSRIEHTFKPAVFLSENLSSDDFQRIGEIHPGPNIPDAGRAE